MDQIRGAKKHTLKVQLQLNQPVSSVPVTYKPVLNAAPFKDESRTVVKSGREEATKPRFYKKEGFKRKPLLWS